MQHRRPFLLASGILVLLALALAPWGGRAADATKDGWPLFRGNVEQTGTGKAALPDKLKVKWTFKTGKDGVDGTAAIVSGIVYIGSFDSHLYAIDLATGKEKWKAKLGPIKAAVAYRDGLLYVGDDEGKFYCVDAEKGITRWTFDAKSDVTSGATFAGDDILFGTGGSDLVCLSKEGKLRWTFNVPGGPVNASPAVAAGVTFVAGCDSALHVIDVKSGKEVRSVELAGQVGATGALGGDVLYIGTMTSEVQAVDWKKGRVLWTFKPAKGAQPFQASVALAGDLVIAGSKDRRVYALNRKDGTQRWSYQTEGRVDSSPVVVGKRVYAASSDGYLHVLDLEKGTLVQKIELDGEINGSPAVAGGCLVIATVKGTVYCLGE